MTGGGLFGTCWRFGDFQDDICPHVEMTRYTCLFHFNSDLCCTANILCMYFILTQNGNDKIGNLHASIFAFFRVPESFVFSQKL